MLGYVDRVPSRFHEEALRQLSLAYEADADALSALERRAAELGVRFPASFVEWYGMRDGIALLQQHSNTDWPVEIAKLGTARWPFETSVPGSAHGPMLQFMVENQQVCTWGIPLDAGDDPPVLVAVDPDFKWRDLAPSFSTFIACQIWDHDGGPNGGLLLAQACELAPGDLELLRRSCRERPTTHGWPTRNVFRFERDDAHILIWDAERQADWWISAHSEESLTAIAREVWRCGDLSTSLYSNDPCGEEVLRVLRGE